MTIKVMIIKVLRKLGIFELLYKIKRTSLINNEECTMSVTEALNKLENFSHDPKTSSIDKKSLGDKFDLEVIIPAYNVEKYIRQCMDSVMTQNTKYKYHVTVIDDGSQDDTGRILDEYKIISNITVIHQQNLGFSGARNTGIREASGKYIMFVDSDDFISGSTIQSLLDSAFLYNADIVEGGVISCTESGKKYHIAHCHKKCGKSKIIELSGWPFCKVFKKYLFENVSFPEKYWYEDSIMRQIIYPKAERIYAVNNNLYFRRDNPTGITNTAIKKKKSVDSLYITLSLYRDRHLLGIKPDLDYYEYILRMVNLTYSRMRLQPEEIKESMFIVFCDFIDNNFPYYKTELYPDLEYSLKNRKYELFKAWCEK